MSKLGILLKSAAVFGAMSLAAPAMAGTANITLNNTNTSQTFTKFSQNICGTQSPTPAASLGPGQLQAFTVSCATPGSAGGLTYTTTSGKRCEFQWSLIRSQPGSTSFVPSSSARSTGTATATCRVTSNPNITTGNGSWTFTMN